MVFKFSKVIQMGMLNESVAFDTVLPVGGAKIFEKKMLFSRSLQRAAVTALNSSSEQLPALTRMFLRKKKNLKKKYSSCRIVLPTYALMHK